VASVKARPWTHGRFAYPAVGTRTVTFSGSPAAGGRVVVTVNKFPVEYEAKDGDTLETITQNVADEINRVGRGGHHGNRLRAGAGHFFGPSLKIVGDHPGPSWEPSVTATADPPLLVSVDARPRRAA
jgi:hypothetical protein